MSTRPLSDEEVNQEMRKMVAFIKQEAIEKAREIQVKADEEFNIEKAKLVRQEALFIEASYVKKYKLSNIQRKIAQSAHINKSRLKLLAARDELLESLFEEARNRLKSISRNHEVYKSLLQQLLLQCLFILMEESVIIKIRKEDLHLMKEIANLAIKDYQHQLGRTVKINLMEDSFLPETSAGGLIAFGRGGKISCDNTLEKRLELLCEKMLPEIRVMILGPSESRKFFD